MTPEEGPRVVVGVDPSEHATTALDWAADEAVLRGWPLRIVHARGAGASRLAEISTHHAWEDAERAARTLLEGAERRAREGHGVLVVTTSLLDDAPLPGLIGAVDPADLLVLGAQRAHARFAPPLGRVVQRVLHQAECPVALVPQA
ncbi:universal stress protein [Streptacidiphilus anmyonensis]|uniref:universal stress protein n=1 Tax=Streptacidiphilus anmyonensis TaxID=405782 RepID=UPI00069385A8|nr:universal stress protein [Streptacidiphilus anmyonensis]